MDDHIKMELCKLQSSIKKMSGETRIFEDIDALHAKSESTKAFLSQLTTEYRDRTESVESKAQLIELKLDKDRRILDKKPTWKKLVALEEKLSAQKQCIHELRDKVSTKRRATDFDSLKDSCAYLVDRMNNAAIQNLVVQNPEWQQ